MPSRTKVSLDFFSNKSCSKVGNTFSVLPIPFWKSLNEINYIGNTHVQKTYNTELEFYLLKRSIDRRNVKMNFPIFFF